MKEFRKRRAFRVLIGCMLVQGAGIGLTFNCIGVFMVAICADKGFSTASFSVFSSVRGLCAALILPLVVRIVYHRWKEHNRYFIIALGSVSFLALASGVLFDHVEAWYGIGVLMGIGGVLFNMNQAFVISNWCVKRRNLFIGLAGASSGIVGFLFNPVASALIVSLGWQPALLILCALGLAAIWVGGWQMRLTPEEVGCTPYGHDAAGAVCDAAGEQDVVPYRKPEFMLVVGALMLVVFTGYTLATTLPHLPNYAGELGYTLTIGSLFSSFAMAGNVIGKVSMGALCDRFAIGRVSAVCYMLQLAALVCIAFLAHHLAVALACCFFLGTAQSAINVLMHMVVRKVFGSKRYIRMFSSLFSIGAIVSAPMFALAGYSFDLTGSYFTSLLVLSAAYSLACVAIIVIFTVYRKAAGRSSTAGEAA